MTNKAWPNKLSPIRECVCVCACVCVGGEVEAGCRMHSVPYNKQVNRKSQKITADKIICMCIYIISLPSIPFTSSYALRLSNEGDILFIAAFSASGLFGTRSYSNVPSGSRSYRLWGRYQDTHSLLLKIQLPYQLCSSVNRHNMTGHAGP